MSAYLKFCKTCQFERAGECRFGPPTAIRPIGMEGHPAGVWPNVMPSDWCYQWKYDAYKAVSTDLQSGYGENPELLAKGAAR